jgi:peptidylprolyl isomerase
MKKLSNREWVAVGVSILFIAYMFFGNIIMSAFRGVSANQPNARASQSAAAVQYKDVVVGSGVVVGAGMQVSINYVFRLADGTVIQDSKLVGSGEPVKFIAGAGQLNSSWENAIIGMRVGGKRIITIPPELGYGPNQVGPIPPNSTLIFEIEVVSAAVPLK